VLFGYDAHAESKKPLFLGQSLIVSVVFFSWPTWTARAAA